MDETEITNNEYRQFVNWVKDSIIKTRLAITADEQEKKPGTGGIGEFAFADADTTKMSVYDKYMYKNYYSVGSDDDIYSPDGYEQVSDLDEIFITSDKRRYFIDSAISDSNSRISIFKDGKGFLNFRIYDFEVGEKNSTYNIATSIKHFMFGEVHHIAASWKLNSTDESDQMHLFIDGFEAPNLYKFGGTIPLKLNSKFSDISQEILQDYLFRNITYSADMVGSISAGDNKILSSSISGTEDIISRGILIKSSNLDENSFSESYSLKTGTTTLINFTIPPN
jgi:hypothetical protein